MNLALFHTTLPGAGRKLGGAELVVHRLANALTELGDVNVTVYSLTGAPSDAKYHHRRVFSRYPWLVDNPLGRLIVLPALLNFVPFEGADVLHFHGDDWFYVRRKRPTVRTFHGSALLEATIGSNLEAKDRTILCISAGAAGRFSRACIYGDRQIDRPALPRKREHRQRGLHRVVLSRPQDESSPDFVRGNLDGQETGEFMFNVFIREVLPAYPEAKLCMVSDYCPTHVA